MAANIGHYYAAREQVERNHTWRAANFADDSALELELIGLLATKIMAYRCRANERRFEAWEGMRTHGRAADDTIRRALEVIIQSGVGLPSNPKPDNHVHGFVAEHLWYFFVVESASDDHAIRIEGPSVEVTETGGDGLVIHQIRGKLLFRLWEIKKYQGNRTITRTIGRACTQLSKNAERYLNKYSLLGQYESDVQVAALYGQLLDHWIDGTDSASLGVSIATSARNVPTKCFGALPLRFPRLVRPGSLIGLVKALSDFDSFSLSVRDEIWKGL